jgi:YVTN family beta-propeller protein
VAVACAAIVGFIAEDAREPHGPLPIDRSALAFVLRHRGGAPAEVARVVSHLGDALLLIPLALVAGVWLWRRRQPLAVALVPLATLLCASVTETVMKHVIDRPRPPARYHLVVETNASFPSGHATAAAALFMAIALTASAILRSRPRRVMLVAACGVIAAAVAAARVVLGVHWLTDVVAGWFLGAAWAFGISAIVVRSVAPPGPSGETQPRRFSLARRGFTAMVACSLVASGACAQHDNVRAAPVRRQPAPPTPRSAANVYAHDGAGMLTGAARDALPRIYVPNSDAASVDVIDPETMKVVDHFAVGRNPQHVVPAWDLGALYVTNDRGNSLTPIDPATGKVAGANIPVADPYNLYFTPDGASAIVVAEAQHRLDFRDPHTFALQKAVPVACRGVDHIDFAADNSYLIATCEFSGQLVKVDLRTRSVTGYLTTGGKPQDIKLEPQGHLFYVADMDGGGLFEVDGDSFVVKGFLPTGPEAHGLYPSRDASVMYVSNRGGRTNRGSVSVVDFTTRRVVATWKIPDGGTPDMGGVSADGATLWLSGRRSAEVYAFDTSTGALRARIPVGAGPHGLCVWPQPGRYSLGHTGILR